MTTIRRENTITLLSNDPRWDVEDFGGALSDIGASQLTVLDSGALVFEDHGDVLLILAPRTWKSVTPQLEEREHDHTR